MQSSLSKLQNYLPGAISFFKQYAAFIFIVVLLGVYVIEVNHIGQLIQQEPSGASDSSQQSLAQLKVDQDSIQKITDLESQNVEVKSIFETARNNPFQD